MNLTVRRGSTTGRPLMAALDLFGRRWVLRIMWELRDEPLGFRPLQRRRDGMSSSVLGQRLTELGKVALVGRTDDGRYALTTLGRDLGRPIKGLEAWSARWTQTLGPGPRPVRPGRPDRQPIRA